MKALLCAALLCASLAFAEGNDAIKELASVHDFAFGGIGAAGTMSKGEPLFREILAGPNAEKDFLELLASGNPQARCYALVALRKLNPEQYAERVRPFEHDQTEVSQIAGCIVMVLPMASIVPNISSGRYDSYLQRKLPNR